MFSAFAGSIEDAVVIAGDEHFITYANSQAERRFDYPPGALIGADLILLFPERHRDAFREGMVRLERGERRGAWANIRLECARRDGSEFPVELSLSGWRNDSELHIAVIIRDVRVASPSAAGNLLITEQRLSALLEHSADAVLLIDAEGLLRYRSPAARGVMGYSDEAVIGRPAFDFVHPDQREWVISTFRAAVRRKGVVTQAFRGLRDDGAVRWLEVTISNHLDHPVSPP